MPYLEQIVHPGRQSDGAGNLYMTLWHVELSGRGVWLTPGGLDYYNHSLTIPRRVLRQYHHYPYLSGSASTRWKSP